MVKLTRRGKRMCRTCRVTYPKTFFPEGDIDFFGCNSCREITIPRKRGNPNEKGYSTTCRGIRLKEKLENVPFRDISLVSRLQKEMHEQGKNFIQLTDILSMNECEEVLAWMKDCKSKKVQIGITKGDNR